MASCPKLISSSTDSSRGHTSFDEATSPQHRLPGCAHLALTRAVWPCPPTIRSRLQYGPSPAGATSRTRPMPLRVSARHLHPRQLHLLPIFLHPTASHLLIFSYPLPTPQLKFSLKRKRHHMTFLLDSPLASQCPQHKGMHLTLAPGSLGAPAPGVRPHGHGPAHFPPPGSTCSWAVHNPSLNHLHPTPPHPGRVGSFSSSGLGLNVTSSRGPLQTRQPGPSGTPCFASLHSTCHSSIFAWCVSISYRI